MEVTDDVTFTTVGRDVAHSRQCTCDIDRDVDIDRNLDAHNRYPTRMTADADFLMAASLVPQGKHVGQPPIGVVRPATIVGSRSRTHVHLVSNSVSKTHAAIIRTSRGFYVRDLASREGVYINGSPHREADLADGDLLKIGNFVFRFTVDTQSDSLRTHNDITQPVRLSVAGSPELSINSEGGRSILIGNRPGSDMAISDSLVSSTHALLYEVDGQWFVRDLVSRTGTFLNGRKVHQEMIGFGDEIRIGSAVFNFGPVTSPAAIPAIEAPQSFADLDDLTTDPLSLEQPETVEPIESIEPLAPVVDEQPLTEAPTPAEAESPLDPIALDDAPASPATETKDSDDSLLSWDDETPASPAAEKKDNDDSLLSWDDDALPPQDIAWKENDSDIETPIAADVSEPVATEPTTSATADLDDEIAAIAESLPVEAAEPAPSRDEKSVAPAASEPELKLPPKAETTTPPPPAGNWVPMGVVEAESKKPADNPVTEPPEDLVELDLDLADDPDVSGPEETTTISVRPDDTRLKPFISEQVVDAPVPIAPTSPVARNVEQTKDDASNPSSNQTADASIAEPELQPRKGWRRGKPAPPVAQPPASPPPAAEVPDIVDDVAEEPDAPAPVNEPAAMDFSHLVMDDVPAASEPPLDDEKPMAPEVEAELIEDDLPPQKSRRGEVDPNADTTAPTQIDPGAVQLIAPDAFDLPAAPPADTTPKSRKPRKPTRKAIAETQPEPEKPAPPVTPVAPVGKRGAAGKAGKNASASKAPITSSIQKPTKPASRKNNPPRKPPAPVAPPIVVVEADDSEIIDETSPTPESALNAFDDVRDESIDESNSVTIDPVTPLVEPDAMSDTTFGRQLQDFSADSAEPIIDASPEVSEATEMPIAAEVSAPVEPITTTSTTDLVEEPPRPRNTLEQIAATFTATPLDETEVEELPAVPVPTMGMIEAESKASAKPPAVVEDQPKRPEEIAEVPAPVEETEPVEQIDLSPEVAEAIVESPEMVEPAEAVAPTDSIAADPAPIADIVEPAPPVVEQRPTLRSTTNDNDDDWRMPDESDLLLPPDDPLESETISENPDSAINVGGMRLASLSAPAVDPEPAHRVDPPSPRPADPEAPAGKAKKPTPTDFLPKRKSLADADTDYDLVAPEGLPDELDLADLPAPGAEEESKAASTSSDETTKPTSDAELDLDELNLDEVIDEAAPSNANEVETTETVQDEIESESVETPPPVVQEAPAVVDETPVVRTPPRPNHGRGWLAPTPFAGMPLDAIPDSAVVTAESIPPYTGSAPATQGPVTTAFDGLAMPPVREADVFSNQLPGHSMASSTEPDSQGRHDPLSGGNASAGTEETSLATIDYAGRAPVPARKIARPATPPAYRPPTMPGVSPGGATPERPAGKKRWLRLKWLLPAMFIATAAGAAGVYAVVPHATPVEGYLQFVNLDKASADVKTTVQTQQHRLALGPEIRQQAAGILTENSNVSEGFLGATEQAALERDKVAVDFPQPPGNQLVVRLRSEDPAADAQRIAALLTAIASANKTMNDRAAELKEVARRSAATRDEKRTELSKKEDQREQARQVGENRPAGEDEVAIEAAVKATQKANAEALLTLNDRKAELEQLQSMTAPPAGTIEAATRRVVEAQAMVETTSSAYISADQKFRLVQAAKAEALAAWESQKELERQIAALSAEQYTLNEKAIADQARYEAAITVAPYEFGRSQNITYGIVTDMRPRYVAVTTVLIWALFGGLIVLGRRAAMNDNRSTADEYVAATENPFLDRMLPRQLQAAESTQRALVDASEPPKSKRALPV